MFSLVMVKGISLLWWRPRKIEEHFSKQGIRGPPYHFFIGNVKELVGMMLKASSHPMPFSHNILPRVLSFNHHWRKICGTLFIAFSFFVVAIDSADLDDRAAMLQISRAFKPHPPRWSTLSSFAYCKWKGVECNPRNHCVMSINVSGLSLGGSISPAISSLPELTEVYLQNNNLSGEIPKLPEQVNLVYRPGNPLLRQKSGDNGLTIGIVIGSIVGGALIILIAISLGIYVFRFRTVQNGDHSHLYTMESLRLATNDFSDANVLGQGGFGVVYRGVQSDGTLIAVKRKDFRVVDEQAMSDFNNETSVFASLRHKHLVSLLGFCDHGPEKLLVYEYMPQGTLSQHLFEWRSRSYTPLTWDQRVTIALDVARGIQYLHGLARKTYIHRDLKPSNILLGDGMRAKISDFGCVKLLPEGVDSVETAAVVGTFGYIDPDYVGTRRVSKKADVYAFGVILMEMITGRKANDETLSEEEQNLVMWLRPRIKDSRFLSSIDMSIPNDEATVESIKKIAKLAEHCTFQDVDRRPNIFQTVSCLASIVERWEPPSEEEDPEPEDTTTLLQKLDRWKNEAGQGTSTFAYGEPSGHTEIEMTRI